MIPSRANFFFSEFKNNNVAVNAVSSTLLFTFAGPLLLKVISVKSSIDMQGYYFVFVSLQAVTGILLFLLSKVLAAQFSALFEGKEIYKIWYFACLLLYFISISVLHEILSFFYKEKTV